MPQVIKPSNITIVQGENGTGKLLITLELNINLNADGMQASISAQKSSPQPIAAEEDEVVGFEIPDFNATDQINFGKDVRD